MYSDQTRSLDVCTPLPTKQQHTSDGRHLCSSASSLSINTRTCVSIGSLREHTKMVRSAYPTLPNVSTAYETSTRWVKKKNKVNVTHPQQTQHKKTPNNCIQAPHKTGTSVAASGSVTSPPHLRACWVVVFVCSVSHCSSVASSTSATAAACQFAKKHAMQLETISPTHAQMHVRVRCSYIYVPASTCCPAHDDTFENIFHSAL